MDDVQSVVWFIQYGITHQTKNNKDHKIKFENRALNTTLDTNTEINTKKASLEFFSRRNITSKLNTLHTIQNF